LKLLRVGGEGTEIGCHEDAIFTHAVQPTRRPRSFEFVIDFSGQKREALIPFYRALTTGLPGD
jgi:hypothetical protein